jgi:hypothetical protein
VKTIFDSKETEIVVLALEFVDDQVFPTIEASIPDSREQILGLKMKVTLKRDSWFRQIMLVVLLEN